LNRVRFCDEDCATPPAPIRLSTLDSTVFGRDKSGSRSAPAKLGVVDATSVEDGGHKAALEVEFEIFGEQFPIATVVGDRNMPPKTWISPGSHGPIDPRTVSKIKDETRVDFATFPVRCPGIHRRTRPVSDKIRRRRATGLLFLRGLEQYCAGKVKMKVLCVRMRVLDWVPSRS